MTVLALSPLAAAQPNQNDARLNSPALTAPGSATVSVRQLAVPHAAQQAVDAATDSWRKQQWKKARVQAVHALSIYPDYGPALALLGFLDLQEGALELACSELKRAIESDPNAALAYVALGSAYNSLQRYEEALETLSVVPSLAADNWQVHYELARALIGLRKYDLGLEEINSSQRLAQQDPAVLHLGKAHALLGLHRASEAAHELETIVRQQPHGPYASDAQSLLATLRSQGQR